VATACRVAAGRRWPPRTGTTLLEPASKNETLPNAPATGERTALQGYRWQHDQLAAIVYDSLLNKTFESMRLVDPTAGKVDDLVLIRTTGPTGHQFKSTEAAGARLPRRVLRDAFDTVAWVPWLAAIEDEAGAYGNRHREGLTGRPDLGTPSDLAHSCMRFRYGTSRQSKYVGKCATRLPPTQ
jgi:hypothetical protein